MIPFNRCDNALILIEKLRYLGRQSSILKKESNQIDGTVNSQDVDVLQNSHEDAEANISFAEWFEENGRFIFAGISAILFLFVVIPAVFLMSSPTSSNSESSDANSAITSERQSKADEPNVKDLQGTASKAETEDTTLKKTD